MKTIIILLLSLSVNLGISGMSVQAENCIQNARVQMNLRPFSTVCPGSLMNQLLDKQIVTNEQFMRLNMKKSPRVLSKDSA